MQSASASFRPRQDFARPATGAYAPPRAPLLNAGSTLRHIDRFAGSGFLRLDGLPIRRLDRRYS